MIADVDSLIISFSSLFEMFVFCFFFFAGIVGFVRAVFRPLMDDLANKRNKKNEDG